MFFQQKQEAQKKASVLLEAKIKKYKTQTILFLLS
jgi:hypothetical protein